MLKSEVNYEVHPFIHVTSDHTSKIVDLLFDIVMYAIFKVERIQHMVLKKLSNIPFVPSGTEYG